MQVSSLFSKASNHHLVLVYIHDRAKVMCVYHTGSVECPTKKKSCRQSAQLATMMMMVNIIIIIILGQYLMNEFASY